ncbi:MAG: response regulator transcription factor [Candidatus Nitronauta litoralis]|uniref:Response regulator transcription factor n=1 Tax=Candidatus Nitronauta litoralis TaxID=2705533 RepID=A0A7T0FYT7_9BACT|nr:MAG: response regulator transcription factor [Candidatus Nitronauta litoralis]
MNNLATRRKPITLLIVDDHPLFRRGLKNAFSETNDIEVIGEADSGHGAVNLVKKCKPSLVLLDIALPDKHGLEVVRQMQEEFPKVPLLVLSMYPEDQYAVRFFKAGVAGYLTKDSNMDTILEAVRKVAGGGKFATPKVTEKLAFDFLQTDKPLHELLSDREYQVFLMIASGKTLTEIGEELSLSVKTISTYRTRILEKLKMKKNAEIIYYAIENQLI